MISAGYMVFFATQKLKQLQYLLEHAPPATHPLNGVYARKPRLTAITNGRQGSIAGHGGDTLATIQRMLSKHSPIL